MCLLQEIGYQWQLKLIHKVSETTNTPASASSTGAGGCCYSTTVPISNSFHLIEMFLRILYRHIPHREEKLLPQKECKSMYFRQGGAHSCPSNRTASQC